MRKILIVDDEEKIREVLREYAEFEGYDVYEAEDGFKAIEIAKKRELFINNYGYNDA
jgi:Response regulators consisting of a CheY-like receiver domain and a winged-helix DNA-binding domain